MQNLFVHFKYKFLNSNVLPVPYFELYMYSLYTKRKFFRTLRQQVCGCERKGSVDKESKTVLNICIYRAVKEISNME
jgi:hypothetical protein